MNNSIYSATERRTQSFRRILEEKQLDAAFLCSGPNVRYLSGFAGTPGDAALVITPDKAYIITDSRYTIQAGEQCPYYTLVSGNATDINMVKGLLPRGGSTAVGFENLNISYDRYTRLCSILDSGNEPVRLDNAVENLRNIKDSIELDCIRRACKIACKALSETVPYIQPGAAELDVATELEYRMKKNGASGPSFDTIVASGVRGALPHGLASEKLIKNGELVTIDFGALYNGYCSDMTRTFAVGEPCDELKKIYNIVLGAQLTALDAYKPDMLGRSLDQVARDYIAEAGYGKYFGHGLGHGVGLEIHEGVGVGAHSVSVLAENTVFSVEPGIYIENLGGVRIEDLVTYSDGVFEILTADSPKAFTVL